MKPTKILLGVVGTVAAFAAIYAFVNDQPTSSLETERILQAAD